MKKAHVTKCKCGCRLWRVQWPDGKVMYYAPFAKAIWWADMGVKVYVGN